MILGIDTSNYTTSLCLVEKDIIIEKRKLLEVKKGEKGLRQSDAVFLHNRNLPSLFKEFYNGEKIDAIGVSFAPRNSEKSYMPCFTVGVGYGEILSKALGVPIYKFSHQQGHIMAAISSINMENLLDEKFIAFHISGGTSDVLEVSPFNDGLEIKKIGGSLDLNIGQAVDRIGIKLGLSFPCGKELEKLALKSNIHYSPKISVSDMEFNVSGMENMAEDMIKKGESKENVASFVYDFIIKTIEKVLNNIYAHYPEIPVIFAGGVMSSDIISSYFTSKYNCFFSKSEFSSDNAFGIAKLAERKFYEQRT